MKQAKLLTDAEFKRFTAIINALRYQTRNHTIVALSFYAGLRACEIAALKVADVFDEAGVVKDTIYMSKDQTKAQTAPLFWWTQNANGNQNHFQSNTQFM